MLKNSFIIILLVLITGCTSLKPTDQAAVLGAPQVDKLRAENYSSAECKSLDDAYSLWGSVSKSLAVLAGLTPATGVASGVAALVGASSAGVAFYADTRAAAFVKDCS